MDPTLYTAATIANVDVLIRYKDQLLNQITSPTKNTVLHVIAQHNDSADAIQQILSNQDSGLLKSLLIWKNSEGETALYIATRNRRDDVVLQLLTTAHTLSSRPEDGNNGEVVPVLQQMVRMWNKNGDTPLHEAVNNKDEANVEVLVKADPNYQHLPNKMGKTPLYIALEKRAGRNSSALVRFLCYFIHCFDVSSYGPSLGAILEFCISPGIEGPNGETVLHAAARREGTSEWVPRICKRVPNITKKQDNQGFTALHHAAYFNNHNAAKYLLEAEKSMAYTTADKDKYDSMTPLHIAASRGHTKVIEQILENCQDCWDRLTSKGQNILHLAAKGQHTESIDSIMKQPWAINILNMKDNYVNTPSHLLLSSMPKDVIKTLQPLLEHPNVYVDAFNDQHYTPLEMFDLAEIQTNPRKVKVIHNLQNKFGKLEKVRWMIDDRLNGNPEEDVNNTKRLEEMKQTAETHLLVAALIATVTFAAGFTLPGGYDGNAGPDQGLAVLIRKAAFKVFIATDTVALISSCVAIFLHLTATLYKHNERQIYIHNSLALMYLIIAMISMAVTFVTGLYVVLVKSPAIAISVCIIGWFGIAYLLHLILKVDRELGFIIVDDFLGTIFLGMSFIYRCISAIWACVFQGRLKGIFEKMVAIWKCIVSFCCEKTKL